MKICFLGPSSSAHIIKWCKWFSDRGHEVHVVSFSPDLIKDSNVHYVNSGANIRGADLQKIKYLFNIRKVREIIKSIEPDVINVHYASSYGTIAALLGLNNYVLSMWGSDIFQFPRKSVIHKKIIQFSLNRAPFLFSTSKAMANEAHKYVKKDITVTPFGVDTRLFSPNKRENRNSNFVIGTVKAVEKKYGIEYLLMAAEIVKRTRPDIPLELRIAGRGREEKELQKLGEKLGLGDNVKWLGFISQEEAAFEWANFDVAVVYSTVQESFGVSAVEAQSCGTPLIISNTEGLMEATNVGKSCVSLPKENASLLAKTLIEFYDSPSKRSAMGKEGRTFVEKNYEINECFMRIEAFFDNIINYRCDR